MEESNTEINEQYDNDKKVNKVKVVIFILLISVVLYITFKYRHKLTHINPRKIEAYINSMRPFSEIVYLLIFVVKPFFVFIPSNVVFLMGSVIFGPLESSILSIMGLFISGTVSFYIAKFLGKDFVHKILGKRLVKIDDKLEKDGFRILFMIRLPPVLPYDPLSYACGFTKIKYSHFILASVLGVAPETICYSILGRNFKSPFTPQFIIPISILIIGTVFSRPIMNSVKKRKEEKKMNHEK